LKNLYYGEDLDAFDLNGPQWRKANLSTPEEKTFWRGYPPGKKEGSSFRAYGKRRVPLTGDGGTIEQIVFLRGKGPIGRGGEWVSLAKGPSKNTPRCRREKKPLFRGKTEGPISQVEKGTENPPPILFWGEVKKGVPDIDTTRTASPYFSPEQDDTQTRASSTRHKRGGHLPSPEPRGVRCPRRGGKKKSILKKVERICKEKSQRSRAGRKRKRTWGQRERKGLVIKGGKEMSALSETKNRHLDHEAKDILYKKRRPQSGGEKISYRRGMLRQKKETT